MRCDTPLSLKLETPLPYFDEVRGVTSFIDTIPINCGKCLNCKKNRINGWSFRLMKETQISQSAHFVTLTYATQFIPLSDRGYQTLDKNDLKAFFKKLRKLQLEDSAVNISDVNSSQYNLKLDRKRPLKYYSVGEFGSIRKRPHYHIILFNLVNPDLISKAWTKIHPLKLKDGNGKYIMQSIGHVHIDSVNNNTVDYTLKYISKKQTKYYKNFDGQKEFSLMSKNLGMNYLTDEIEAWHNASDDNHYLINNRGIKIPIPKVYRDKIYTKEDKERLLYHIKNAVDKNDQKMFKKYGDKLETMLTLAKHSRELKNNKNGKERTID